MRLSRMFMLPITCMAMTAAFLFSPVLKSDYGQPGVYALHNDAAPDLAQLADKFAAISDQRSTPSPAGQPTTGEHALIYASANRPLSKWRLTVDAYRHIDPGRSAA